MTTVAPSSAPVAIFVGRNVDDSAGPPTYERNRYVADLVLNYACYPFMAGPDNVLTSSALLSRSQLPSPATSTSGEYVTSSSPPRGVPQSSDGRPALSPKAYSAPSLSIWAADATARYSTPTFIWFADAFPPVGIEEMCAFHDESYVRYLRVRETLSEVDELSSVMKRRRAESRQPTSTVRKRSAVIAAIEGDPVAARAIASETHPVRLLPDLEPLESDDDHGLNNDACPFVGMWRTIQTTVSGTLTAVRWLTELQDGVEGEVSLPHIAPVPTVREASSSPHVVAVNAPVRSASRVTPLDKQCLEVSSTTGALASSSSPLPSPGMSATATTTTPRVGSLTLHRAVPATTLQRSVAVLGTRWAALHWFGGRHHAMRDAASGFCYVNDVVLAAMALRAALPAPRRKILIVDLDAHHGDGTQAAFLYDPNYYVLSVHAYGLGLFPHSGAASEVGRGPGTGYTANVTLPEGATDSLMVPLTRQAIKAAIQKLGESLGAIVLVCGADGLQGDEVGKLNYTLAGLQCVTRLVIEQAVERGVKLLVLGAGGYVDTSVARLASVVTRDVLSAAAAVQQMCRASSEQLASCDLDLFFASPALTHMGVPVPDSCEYFTHYGPSFLMHGLPGAKVAKVDHLEPGQPYYTTLRQMLERGTNSRRTSITSVT